MGNVVPDRFFWALPPTEEAEGGEGTDPMEDDTAGAPRRVH
jgi:hydroxymethylpyrimidine/phosphomethylpyrimidine kinase